MSCVVGIDLSSHYIDLIRLDETHPHAEWTRIRLDGGSSWDRTRRIPQRMPRHTWWDTCYLTAIERPYGPSRRAQAVLMRVQGAVLASIPAAVQVWEVAPDEWKRPLGIKTSEKPTLEQFPGIRLTRFGCVDELAQDALDALGVALWARELNAKGIAA